MDSLNDEEIARLFAMPKRFVNSSNRWIEKHGHKQRAYAVHGESGEKFEVYLRQNMNEGMEEDYSAGLLFFPSKHTKVTLCRYNGPHDHPNRLEKTRTGKSPHIHIISTRYIEAGLKPEGFAEATDRYSTLKSAFTCLITDLNIESPDLAGEDGSPTLFSKGN